MTRSEFNKASISAALGAWIGFVVGPNAMIAATNSNFLAVLPDALHTSRTAISSALAGSLWLVALLVPLAGRTMDRFGLRAVMVPGVVLFGAMFLLFSRMTSIWQFMALQALLAVPIAMHSSVGYAKLIALWFDRHRGVVLGLCVALGAGVSQTLMPKISRALIVDYGWRGGYVGIALIVLLLGAPLIFLLVRQPHAIVPRAQMAQEATRVPAPLDQLGVTRGEALRQPIFYLVFFGILFASLALLGTMQHIVPMLSERGVGVDTATTVMSFAFAGVVIGEFSSGFLVDRVNTPRIILPYFICALVGVLTVHIAATPPMLMLGGILMGLGLGGEVGQNAYLVSRYFGLKAFGAIYGMTFAASAIGNGLGLILLSYIRDHSGSYAGGRYLVGTAMTISVLCIASLRPFVYASGHRGR